MNVAVIGSRNFHRPDIVRSVVGGFPSDVTVVSGGARGVDTEAECVCRERGIDVHVIAPDYAEYGRNAPIVRNRGIVEAADEVVAFWDGESRGTAYTVAYALRLGRNVSLWDEQGREVRCYAMRFAPEARFAQDPVPFDAGEEM